ARPDLFAVLDGLDTSALAAPDARAIALWHASAKANGAHLGPDRRESLAQLQARESELVVAISQAFVEHLPILELTADELDGLPADVLARLEPGEAPGSLRVRVEYGMRDEFLTNVRSRAVRERFWRTLQDRALDATLEPMGELFRVRREIARLSGFGSWADMRTFFGALGSVEHARSMLRELSGPAASAAAAFREAATAVLAEELDGDGYQPWDQFRAIRALTGALGADAAALRPYLPLEEVARAMFRLVREVFGIRVEERPGGLGWHEDVRTLALIDDATGTELGTCLWDPWARDGKMAGTVAFMDLLESDAAPRGGTLPPAVTMLVTMVPRPDGGAPATIGVYDAGVLFHEFGHVLDFTLGSRRGAALEDAWWGQDWVEGPSFFLEYWARSPEVFATFARHPETGEPAPAALVDALAVAQAIEDVPYLSKYIQLGTLDLAVHGPDDVDLDVAWREAHAVIPLPDPSGAFRPFPVSMIAGGYDAALYGVCYALAIRDDLLDTARRRGLLSADNGRRYIDQVLRPGPFVPPTERLAAFLDHPVSSEPLVARMGRAIEAARRAAGAKG
ncbi:MAG TPA: M3 family metallopeptidase, partial [Candidatus Limnocylindrales bacterium]|nr:M3 family metallopeptidase [Candidatus Limnocylindrales bacterium]